MKRKKKLIDISLEAERKLSKKAAKTKPPTKLKPFMEAILEREASR